MRARTRPVQLAMTTLALLIAVLASTVPGSSAAFTASVTNSANTAASGFFTCTAAAVAGGAHFTYPLDDGLIGLLTARDVSGNNRPGNYVLLGLGRSQNASSPCRDGGGSSTFSGGQFVASNVQLAAPQTFTTEIWFRTNTAAGLLTGLQGNRTTNASSSHDRHVYLNSEGKLTFGSYNNGYLTITSSGAKTYNDGNWHYVAATMSAAGMRLYADGVLVASSTVTVAEGSTGYWRAGAGNLTGWPLVASQNFTGQLGFFSYYQTALSAEVIAAHHAARA